MNYQDYRNHIKVCEAIGKPPIGKYGIIYDFLIDMWNGMEIIMNFEENQITLQKEGEWYMGYSSEYDVFMCHYEKVWSFFMNNIGTEYNETQEIVKCVLEEHLMCQIRKTGSVDIQ